jgi:glycine dehydrogenase subunit 1
MRYLPLTPDDRRAMLAKIGVSDVDSLFRDVPKPALAPLSAFNLPDTKSELDVERAMSAMAAKNVAASAAPFFCGAGAYKHHVPSAVDHLIQRSEFLTSYTPYQPEIAQGTLQYLFEFQTQVALLTGMEVANASMYDGSTAPAEAVLMAHRVTKRGKAILSGGLHPALPRTPSRPWPGWFGPVERRRRSMRAGPKDIIARIDAETSCVVVQNPRRLRH